MRAAIVFLATFIALAAAAPEMTMEKLQERALCVSTFNLSTGRRAFQLAVTNR